MQSNIEKILFHESSIHNRLDAMGKTITHDYAGKDLTVVAILHGGLILLADLLRRIHLPLKMESISVSSYHGGTESTGIITFNQIKLPDFTGQHVLIVDDILDSGRTLHAIGERLTKECHAASVRYCVLLSKRKQRAAPITPDYVGFEIDDEFVVGYGLDYAGHYRNLPFIGILKPAAIAAVPV
jgi:hypoxanthine phosphoribosyltransferase